MTSTSFSLPVRLSIWQCLLKIISLLLIIIFPRPSFIHVLEVMFSFLLSSKSLPYIKDSKSSWYIYFEYFYPIFPLPFNGICNILVLYTERQQSVCSLKFLGLCTFLSPLKLNIVTWLALANNVNNSVYITSGQMLQQQVHNFLFCADPGSIYRDEDYVSLCPQVIKISPPPPSSMKHINRINLSCVELLRYEGCLRQN